MQTAIISVLNQLFNNFELIIINDGSTDSTESICKKYCLIDKRVKYYNTHNLGAGHARNYGIDKSNGKWLMFLDSDDLLLPNSINTDFIEFLENNGSEDIDYYIFSSFFGDMELKEVSFKKVSPIPNNVIIPSYSFVNGCYKKSFFISKNIRFYEYKKQDIETAFRYLCYSSSKSVIVKGDYAFYLQRNNLSSNTHTWNEQTLHEVKAQVYYDLLVNHCTDKSIEYLSDISINELYTYFSICFRFGINDKASYIMLSKIAYSFSVRKLLKIIGIKKTVLLYFYILVNPIRNKFTSKKVSQVSVGNSRKRADDSDSIIKRLNEIQFNCC